MNRIRKLAVISLLLCVMCLFSGCVTYKSEVSVDKNGKGHVVFSVYYDKNTIESAQFMNINKPEDLAKFFREKIDASTGIKVISDTSSKEKNVLDFRIEFTSLEDLEDKVNKVCEVSSALIDNAEDVFYIETEYLEAMAQEEALKNALVEYLQNNNIKVDVNHRNYRKLVKIIRNAIYSYCVEDEEYDMELFDTGKSNINDNKDEDLEDFEEYNDEILDDEFYIEELPLIILETVDEEVVAKIGSRVLNFMEMYLTSIMEVYGGEVFNVPFIEDNAKTHNGDINYDVYYKTFESVDLASCIRKSIEEKVGTKVTEYKIDDFSPVLAAKLFNDEFNTGFGKAYYDNYDVVYNEQKEDGNDIDIASKIYSERDIKYVMAFDGMVMTASLDDIYELQDFDGYVTLNPNKSINLKDSKNKDIEGLDESPWTGDDTMYIFIIISALVASISMYLVYKKKIIR